MLPNQLLLFTDALPWQHVLRSKMVLEYVLTEFANMEEIFQSLCKSKLRHRLLVSNNCIIEVADKIYMQF